MRRNTATSPGSVVGIGRAIISYWESLQVELHGAFPPDHVKRFNEYVARTSVWRALLVCLWTPVPSIAIAVLMELMPLEDWRTHSIRQSPWFVLRCFVMLVIAGVCYMEQFRQHVPSLQLPRRLVFPIAVTAAAFAVVMAIPLLDRVAYPFPFIPNVAALVGAFAVVGMMRFVIRQQIRTNPRLMKDLRRYLFVCVCQMGMITVYPIYNSAFLRVSSSWGQTAMVLLLPVMKLACKNWISHWITEADEGRSESVIFNVEVFHALYVSFSMQSSPSIHTMAAIMGVDCIQAWLSFHDVLSVVNAATPLRRKHRGSSTGKRNLVVMIDPSLQLAPVDTWTPSTRVHPAASPQSPLQERILEPQESVSSPALTKSPTVRNLPSPNHSTLLQQTQKVLFITEFVALVEYTEILMPCIFNVYMVVMYSLFNRQYYNLLRDLTTDQLSQEIVSVFVYASLEFASLILMATILYRKLRLSLLHQIAFVLETRQASIQAKVVMWAVTVLQSQVQHAGMDYSFEFAWLKAKTLS